jgi:excinuclease ABC subunit C
VQGRMKAAAKELRFEEAAQLRDQLGAIERSLEKQRAVSVDQVDQDAFGLHREGPLLVVTVLFVRQGRLGGGRHFPFKGQEFPDAELLAQLLAQYYDGGAFIPREVLLPLELEDAATHAEWLSEKKGERVHVLAPQRGDKVRLVDMARENASHQFNEWRKKEATSDEVLLKLMKRLGLAKLPRRIECYDNSHLQGTLAVGSRVTFTDSEPDKKLYRHYKIRTAAGDDDFRMMQEVLTRRLSRGKEEGDLPDLIVIDGGKGQLGVARAVLQEQGLSERVELCSLAKARVVDDEALFAARQGFAPEDFHTEAGGTDGEMNEETNETVTDGDDAAVEPHRGAGKSRNAGRWKKGTVEQSPERIFRPGRKNPIVLRANSHELFLLQRLRDEAHRFAITFQRQLRRTSNFKSVLREIPGVGETRQKALLRHLGSLRRIREASVDELAGVEGFPRKLAEEVFRFFHTDGHSDENAGEAAEALALEDAGLEESSEGEHGELDAESAAVLDEVAEEVGAAAQSGDA